MEDLNNRRINFISLSELEFWLVRILLKKSSLAFDKVNEVGVIGIELKERKFTYFKRRFRGRRPSWYLQLPIIKSKAENSLYIYFINTSIQKLKGPSCIGGFIFFGFQIQQVLFQNRLIHRIKNQDVGCILRKEHTLIKSFELFFIVLPFHAVKSCSINWSAIQS